MHTKLEEYIVGLPHLSFSDPQNGNVVGNKTFTISIPLHSTINKCRNKIMIGHNKEIYLLEDVLVHRKIQYRESHHHTPHVYMLRG